MPTPTPRSFHTPLRYPGGKGKVAAFVKAVFEGNDLLDGVYAEPYCGGAAVALELLFHEYARKIIINDVSPQLAAFWRCALN
jgi:DNA adenine methylase